MATARQVRDAGRADCPTPYLMRLPLEPYQITCTVVHCKGICISCQIGLFMAGGAAVVQNRPALRLYVDIEPPRDHACRLLWLVPLASRHCVCVFALYWAGAEVRQAVHTSHLTVTACYCTYSLQLHHPDRAPCIGNSELGSPCHSVIYCDRMRVPTRHTSPCSPRAGSRMRPSITSSSVCQAPSIKP